METQLKQQTELQLHKSMLEKERMQFEHAMKQNEARLQMHLEELKVQVCVCMRLHLLHFVRFLFADYNGKKTNQTKAHK